MNDKTCNDCAKCKSKKIIAVCEHKGITAGDVPACSHFESATVTNGDKLRQMSKKELAAFLANKTLCPMCPAQTEECTGTSHRVCVRNWMNWLNAPAESEGEDE